MEMDWQPLKDRIARDGLKKGRNEWRASERKRGGERSESSISAFCHRDGSSPAIPLQQRFTDVCSQLHLYGGANRHTHTLTHTDGLIVRCSEEQTQGDRGHLHMHQPSTLDTPLTPPLCLHPLFFQKL